MVALQAQDFAMCKWALGVRLPDSRIEKIDAALDSGFLLRTHALRFTWQLVTAEDVGWLLDLTAPLTKSRLKSRHAELGLTPDLLAACCRVIERALQEPLALRRAELAAALGQAGLPHAGVQVSHIFGWAELEKVICSGPLQNGKPTYALLARRAPPAPALAREEALARLARGYFNSRWPASLADFAWWSGLPVGEARRAIQTLQGEFYPQVIGGQTYYLPQTGQASPLDELTASLAERAFLLPAFDEFLISYTDRRAVLSAEHQARTFSSNGIFYPVIVVDSQVVGVWKRAVKKSRLEMGFDFFVSPSSQMLPAVQAAAAAYARFLGKQLA